MSFCHKIKFSNLDFQLDISNLAYRSNRIHRLKYQMSKKLDKIMVKAINYRFLNKTYSLYINIKQDRRWCTPVCRVH